MSSKTNKSRKIPKKKAFSSHFSCKWLQETIFKAEAIRNILCSIFHKSIRRGIKTSKHFLSPSKQSFFIQTRKKSPYVSLFRAENHAKHRFLKLSRKKDEIGLHNWPHSPSTMTLTQIHNRCFCFSATNLSRPHTRSHLLSFCYPPSVSGLSASHASVTMTSACRHINFSFTGFFL